MNRNKISVSRYFGICWLSLLVGTFMVMSSGSFETGSSESILRPFVFAAVNLTGFVFTGGFIKVSGGENILSYLKKRSRVLSAAAAAVYALIFLYGLIRTAARFDLFASSEMFAQNDTALFSVLILFLCALLSLRGLSALCRAGTVFCIAVAAGTLAVIILSVADNFDFLNFAPLNKAGAEEFLPDALAYACYPVETGAILLFCDRLTGKPKKGFFIWLAVSTVSLFLLAFCVVGTLGAFADTQLFPVYALSTVHGIGLLERLDAVETAVWMLCIVCKTVFYFIITGECLHSLLPGIPRAAAVLCAAAAVSAASVVISGRVGLFGFLSIGVQTTVSYCICVLVLPVFGMIFGKLIKPKKRGGELAE